MSVFYFILSLLRKILKIDFVKKKNFEIFGTECLKRSGVEKSHVQENGFITLKI